jgi:hypothetical protein
VLVLGSILLGIAAGYSIYMLNAKPAHATVIGFTVAAGVFSVGLAMYNAFHV